MKKLLIPALTLTIAISSALGSTQLAFAKKGQDHRHEHDGDCGQMEQMHVNLTPEQQLVSQKLYAKFYSSTASLDQQIEIKSAQRKALMFNPSPDKSRIESISKEIGELKGKLLGEKAVLYSELVKAGIPVREHKHHGGPKNHGWSKHQNRPDHNGMPMSNNKSNTNEMPMHNNN